MPALAKKTTVYFDPIIHNTLKIRASKTSRSISDLINEAVMYQLAEDAEDLKIFEERANEPTISFEDVVKGLKADGKI